MWEQVVTFRSEPHCLQALQSDSDLLYHPTPPGENSFEAARLRTHEENATMVRYALFTTLCLLCFGCSGEETATGKGAINYTAEGKANVVEFTKVKAEPGAVFLTITIPFEKNCVFTADKSLSTDKYGEHRVVNPGTCTLFSDDGQKAFTINSATVDFQKTSLRIRGAGRLEGATKFKFDGPALSIEFEGTY